MLSTSAAPPSRSTPSKAAVARRALELGVELVNDVTALRGDPELAGVVADAGCYLCLMHMQGEPRTMQVDPTLRRRRLGREARSSRSGSRSRSRRACARSSSASTPGSASARRSRTTSSSCAGSTSSRRSDGPCSSGFSRKSSLGKLTGDPDAKVGSAAASVGGAVAAFDRGATILRVHDVREHVEALAVAQAVAG